MPIRKLLVANRAEIAARIIRTARALDIATVAVYSDPDAGLPYVRAAGESVRLPGASPGETYLNAAAIIAAARATGADAVHPGYGFLSENADFAAACVDAGLTFIGPSPAAIAAMGSKIAAKGLMAAAGVPVLPSVAVPSGRPACLPAETAEVSATATDPADARQASARPTDAETIDADPADSGPAGTGLTSAAAKIGYPLLVKAAFGGGGRGMRIVTEPAGLSAAIESAKREAESAFGDGSLFIERFIDNPRHIEVQILGDQDGTVVALFERECSIQRRYQKIIEEAPSPAIDDWQRKELCAAAVTAGQAIGYTSAGTVEFVVDGTGEFWFLEVNTRLQVEHPVTELVTGLDLVELQLRIAAGEPIPDSVTAAGMTGHAIEARLYAEDVAAGYLPVSGTIEAFEIAPAEGLRVDAGYASGSQVSIHYDSMLAKVIACGPSRDAARRTLAAALDQAVLHGVTTNRDLLVAVLRHEEFVAGRFDTGFLTRHPPAELVPAGNPPPLHLLAAALVGQARRRADAPVLRAIPSGWRNNPSALQYATFDGHTVGYRIARTTVPAGTSVPAGTTVHAGTTVPAGTTVHAEIDGVALPPVVVHSVTPDEADLEVLHPRPGDPGTGDRGAGDPGPGNPLPGDPSPGNPGTGDSSPGDLGTGGIRRRITVHVAGDVSYVDSVLGHSALTEAARFAEPVAAMAAGSLVAPMPGTVVRIQAAPSDHLSPGQVIVAIEAMKMEHAITAPVAGRLAELRVAVGDQIDAGTVVAIMDEGAQ